MQVSEHLVVEMLATSSPTRDARGTLFSTQLARPDRDERSTAVIFVRKTQKKLEGVYSPSSSRVRPDPKPWLGTGVNKSYFMSYFSFLFYFIITDTFSHCSVSDVNH